MKIDRTIPGPPAPRTRPIKATDLKVGDIFEWARCDGGSSPSGYLKRPHLVTRIDENIVLGVDLLAPTSKAERLIALGSGAELIVYPDARLLLGAPQYRSEID
jgi:hypothetical protein